MEIRSLNRALWTAVVAMSTLTGCSQHSTYYKSSVVEYLYPNQKEVQPSQVPVISIPVKIGIAFTPDAKLTSGYQIGAQSALTEKEKLDLLTEVGKHFKKYDFIQSIDIIPSTYLTKGGGFTNVDQIAAMYGIDVIVLVSYDQAQFTDEDKMSLSYWTLVGAYFVKGEKNDTHTMAEAAIFDIKSRKMLFQATGTSLIKSEATPVNLSEQMRQDSAKGLRDAGQQLIIKLDEQLQIFRDKVKKSPQEYNIVKKPNS